ncbi:MAG: hypothetical protein Q4B82_08275 [Alysiella sp.]|uniref:hypothetical protein n=1 Tax=Alysiella sp. TaxID=1872483 RepID=UPI0026DC21C3|nr:hypothetical protein [Alysiella sp.]MDO4434557.1 hypothetical protein [Alysiella sp.]
MFKTIPFDFTELVDVYPIEYKKENANKTHQSGRVIVLRGVIIEAHRERTTSVYGAQLHSILAF